MPLVLTMALLAIGSDATFSSVAHAQYPILVHYEYCAARSSTITIENTYLLFMSNSALEITVGNYSIRRLDESEVQLYKSIRLEAIRTEPAMFRCTNPSERDFTDAQWKERLSYPRAVFGLFEHDRIIGMTSIIPVNETEGYLGQSFIKREHRGLGLSTLFYRVRIAWATKLQLTRLKVSHRESNTISKAANQRAGFTYSFRESARWNDGTIEDVLYYVLDLK